MKYRKKDIDHVLKNKNWEGVKRFTDKYSMRLLMVLDNIVEARDFDALKEFVKTYSMEPLLEYGLPVGGEGVKELYDISDRYHSHKNKTGAEWWVRDEIADAVRQLKGFSGEKELLEMIALLWKDVDAEIESSPEIKANAFRKVMIRSIIRSVYRAESEDEQDIIEKIERIFEKSGFGRGIKYNFDFTE